MNRARTALAVAAVALLAAVPVACGGDDASGPDGRPVDTGQPGDTDDNGETIPVDRSTSTTEESPPPPTQPEESPLGPLLTDPADIGAAFGPADAGRGNGTFENDLCEEVTIDTDWTDSASQLLVTGSGEDASTYAESILAFADAAAASAFVTSVVDGLQECAPTFEPETVDVGDEAVLVRLVLPEDHNDVDQRTALVRVGSRVGALRSSTPPSDASPGDEDRMAAVAQSLGA